MYISIRMFYESFNLYINMVKDGLKIKKVFKKWYSHPIANFHSLLYNVSVFSHLGFTFISLLVWSFNFNSMLPKHINTHIVKIDLHQRNIAKARNKNDILSYKLCMACSVVWMYMCTQIIFLNDVFFFLWKYFLYLYYNLISLMINLRIFGL